MQDDMALTKGQLAGSVALKTLINEDLTSFGVSELAERIEALKDEISVYIKWTKETGGFEVLLISSSTARHEALNGFASVL